MTELKVVNNERRKAGKRKEERGKVKK